MSLLIPFTNDLGFTLRPTITRRRRRRDRRHPSWRRLFSLDNEMMDIGDQLEALQEELTGALEDVGMTSGLTLLTPSLAPRSRRVSENEVSGMVAMPGGEEVTQENDKYVVNIPFGDMPAENLKISCKDRVMTIEAKKEEKSEDGNCRLYQEYTRKFTLPENVQPKDVKSVLTPDGVLRIEAPLPQPQLEAPKEPRSIPIQVETSTPVQVK